VAQRLSHEVGWSYKDVVDRLEEKRKIKAQAYHERKVRCLSNVAGGLYRY
jgi:large subunit ribosomal protein L13Ae